MAHKRLGFMQLAILVGFTLYYAWYLIVFFGLFISVPSDMFVEVHMGQVVFFVGTIFATMGILALFRKQGSVQFGHGRFVFLGSLVPGLAMPGCLVVLCTGFELHLGVFYACCLLSGVSAAVGFMQWEDLTVHGYLNRGVLAHGTIFCAGGVLFLIVVLFLPVLQRCIAALLLLCCSTALLAFIVPRCNTIEDRPVEPVRDYFKKVWHVDTVIVVINVAFGYAFMMLYWQNDSTLLLAMGIAIFVDLVFSIALGRGKWLQFTGGVRVCAAIVSCALILFVFPGDIVRDVALCMVIVFWFLFRTLNGGSINDLANQHDYSMLYTSLRGKLPANIGFALGIAVGIVVISANDSALSTLYVPLGIVAAFILSALFLLPFDNASLTAGYKTLALVDMHESRDTSIQRACEMAVKQFKISPREAEVLAYLVKGRNAKHISEKLYISESTVKTHISNIYRKLGVHSQQELLDIIEGIE